MIRQRRLGVPSGSAIARGATAERAQGILAATSGSSPRGIATAVRPTIQKLHARQLHCELSRARENRCGLTRLRRKVSRTLQSWSRCRFVRTTWHRQGSSCGRDCYRNFRPMAGVGCEKRNVFREWARFVPGRARWNEERYDRVGDNKTRCSSKPSNSERSAPAARTAHRLASGRVIGIIDAPVSCPVANDRYVEHRQRGRRRRTDGFANTRPTQGWCLVFLLQLAVPSKGTGMNVIRTLECAAIQAHRAGLSWGDFWTANADAIRQAEPHNRQRFQRLVRRLLALVASGDCDGQEPIDAMPWSRTTQPSRPMWGRKHAACSRCWPSRD